MDVTKEIADAWGALFDLPLTYRKQTGEAGLYTIGEKLVFATAFEGTEGRPYVLVARRQPAHADLQPLGLEIEDPYDLFP